MTAHGVRVRGATADDAPMLARLRRAWAEENGPVGMLNLAVFERMSRPGRPEQRWGHVANVFVLAEHRNGGIGAALLDAAVTHAREQGFTRLVLNSSERSVSLYERFGFRPSRLLQLDLEE